MLRPPTLLCLLALLLVVPCVAQTPAPAPAAAPPAPPPPAIQATVNGSPISQTHVDQAIANRWAIPIMRSIIEDRLIRQEARRLGIKMSVEAVQALFEAERKQFPSQEAFERHLHSQGYTGQSFVEKLTTDSLLRQLQDRQSAVTDAEIARYYAEHKAEFSEPAEAHVFLIQVPTIEEAYLVRERLHRGDKFDVVAKEMSKHPSAAQGGDLGWVGAEDLPGESLVEAVMTMDTGIVSSPLRVDNQYYLVMARERRPEQVVPLEEAREEIRQKLAAGRAVSREDYLDMLARRANIQVTWAPARYLADEYRRLNRIEVIVDGKPLEMEQPPVRLPEGTIVVPAKPVLQAVGAALSWDAGDQSLTASNVTGKVKMTVGSAQAVAGTDKLQAVDMKQPPEIRNGMLYIAARVPLEALGATVQWDGLRNRLVISSGKQDMPSPTVPATPAGLERQ